MRYGSVCSGIESATVAWHPLGWKPAFFAEIDKFPSAVLAHHYPRVPNLRDFTKIRPDQHDPIDLLVGGTPCQSFSVAGLRGGLADGRGNLALEFLRLAERARPRWLVWENVPGVLSSNGGRDFGAILGGMVELGYGFAYRVLDAQYIRVDGFGGAVPQRRRRVFVVGYLGDWRRAAAVLFERASLLGDSPPRREAGQVAAGTVRASAARRGGIQDECGPGGYVALNDIDGACHALVGSHTASGRQDPSAETFIAFSGKDYCADAGDTAPTLRAMGHDGSHANAGGQTAVAFKPAHYTRDKDGAPSTVAYPLVKEADRGGRGAPDEVCPPLKAQSGETGKGGAAPLVAFFSQNSRDELVESDVALSLKSGGGKPGQSYPAIRAGWAVRRLTPKECERLQGFPDGYTDVPWRGKNWTPDGPRYKALGNSMAVNCMRWIGKRVGMVNALIRQSEAA